MRPSRPRPIRPTDILTGFDCGNDVLDDWLRHQALRSEKTRDARTYVTTESDHVVGYYCLSSFSVQRSTAGIGWLTRNAADPVPAVLLGRLAVDRTFQGRGMGSALLADAIDNATLVAERIGSRALVVDAIDETAVAFYRHHEFVAFTGVRGRLAHRI